MTAATWVDPDSIKVASAHGLLALLYRRAPIKQPTETSPAAASSYDDGQHWLCSLDAEERAARAATVENATPTERQALGLFDDVPSGAA